ncbi:MAG: hypothetical protein ACLP0J_22650 [Solirubrobacteraceae bacterium]
MRLARRLWIERFETPRRGTQQDRRVAAASAREADPGSEAIQERPIQLRERAHRRDREQRLGGFESARIELGVRRGERALSSPRRVGRELRGPLEERCGRRGPSARLGT